MSLQQSSYAPHVREFLHFLGSDIAFAIARVATNNRILPTTTDEAIEVVLLHTCDVARFFSYKRIKSQSLFTYLHRHGVPSNGYASKTQLIVAVQQLWVKQMQRNNSNPNPSLVKRRASDPSSPNAREEAYGNGRQDRVNSSTSTVGAKRILRRESPASRSFSESSSVGEIPSNSQLVALNTNASHSAVTPVTCIPSSVETSKVRSDQFTKDFCEWYYTMVNRIQPECSNQPGDLFRENIFFSNSSVDLFLVGQMSEERHAQGASDNFTLITDICKQFRLLYSPNLDTGTQAHKSNHGMVKILCCGTLFQGDAFIGIFEQEFGLMLCPVDRAWKIMYTKVNLKQAASALQPPSLPQCQIFEIEN